MLIRQTGNCLIQKLTGMKQKTVFPSVLKMKQYRFLIYITICAERIGIITSRKLLPDNQAYEGYLR